jgi:hypothetical protein
VHHACTHFDRARRYQRGHEKPASRTAKHGRSAHGDGPSYFRVVLAHTFRDKPLASELLQVQVIFRLESPMSMGHQAPVVYRTFRQKARHRDSINGHQPLTEHNGNCIPTMPAGSWILSTRKKKTHEIAIIVHILRHFVCHHIQYSALLKQEEC